MMIMKVTRKAVSVGMLVFMLSLFPGQAQNRSAQQCALPASIKVDTFESVSLEKLVRIIPVMEAHKNSHGFIITYAGRSSSLAEAQKRADVAKRQLLEKHQWINQSDVLNAR